MYVSELASPLIQALDLFGARVPAVFVISLRAKYFSKTSRLPGDDHSKWSDRL